MDEYFIWYSYEKDGDDLIRYNKYLKDAWDGNRAESGVNTDMEFERLPYTEIEALADKYNSENITGKEDK